MDLRVVMADRKYQPRVIYKQCHMWKEFFPDVSDSFNQHWTRAKKAIMCVTSENGQRCGMVFPERFDYNGHVRRHHGSPAPEATMYAPNPRLCSPRWRDPQSRLDIFSMRVIGTMAADSVPSDPKPDLVLCLAPPKEVDRSGDCNSTGDDEPLLPPVLTRESTTQGKSPPVPNIRIVVVNDSLPASEPCGQHPGTAKTSREAGSGASPSLSPSSSTSSVKKVASVVTKPTQHSKRTEPEVTTPFGRAITEKDRHHTSSAASHKSHSGMKASSASSFGGSKHTWGSDRGTSQGCHSPPQGKSKARELDSSGWASHSKSAKKHKAKNSSGSEEKRGHEKKARRERSHQQYSTPAFSPRDPLLGSAILANPSASKVPSPAEHEVIDITDATDFTEEERLVKQMGTMLPETAAEIRTAASYHLQLLGPLHTTSADLGFCATPSSTSEVTCTVTTEQQREEVTRLMDTALQTAPS